MLIVGLKIGHRSAKQELMKISMNDPSEALRSIAESFCWYKC